MRVVVALSLLLAVFAGCTESDEQARLVIEWGGHNMGIHDINIVVDFDWETRPSSDAYEGKDITHPNYFTIHDLFETWNGREGFDLEYVDGVGYNVVGVFGVINDFEQACWEWKIFHNGKELQASISTTKLANNDVVKLAYRSCWVQPASNVLEFDFNGASAADISATIAYDAVTRPTEDLYNLSTGPRAANFTVHDLMYTWAGYDELDISYGQYGFFLNGVTGVGSVFTNETCWFWSLAINGFESQSGMSTSAIQDGDVVTWRYTDCSS